MTKEGTVLDGKYEILKEIGRGGMSIVYLAMDNRLNKQWAVKEMKNDGTKSTKTLLKGLEREANILKDVDHPVLPRIVDIINNKGTIYVVMDFIEGTNLADVLKEEGAQPQEDVIAWGRQLASALDYLHNMTPPIIYRDMKPSNVMLKPEGDVKLIDFGTAKEFKAENIADTTALGTRGYAAPEQFGDDKGRGIYKTDARTDIYNLGATMYHMVTGKNPNDPPYEMKPIREWNPSLSTGLEKIILKCTQPSPADRYQSCSELMYALDHYTELDESYMKENKKKLALFGATAILTILFGIVSLIGLSGRNKLTAQNYASYIEEGNNFKASANYVEAADKYKTAMDLDGKESAAYVQFIDLYIDASNDVNGEGEPFLKLEEGLTVVANRIKNGYGNVDKNDEVLYRLGLAYYTEMSDYATATKYFKMVDPKDEDYGTLADYYGDISMIRSSANVNVSSLLDNVNGFADYNRNRYANTEQEKFTNYAVLGNIYTTYINEPGVPNKAEEVMATAMEELNEYEGSDAQDFYYSFSDSLSIIYEKMGNLDNPEINYDLAINSCEDVVSQITGKVDVSKESDNPKVKAYTQSYVNKMCKIAELNGKLGKYDEAIATYEEAEATLGKESSYVAKVYAEHLNFMYETFEKGNKDPEKWTKTNKQAILDLYNEGLTVTGIDENTTWIKRSSVMNKLKEQMSAPPEEEKKPEEQATEATDDSSPEAENNEEGE